MTLDQFVKDLESFKLQHDNPDQAFYSLIRSITDVGWHYSKNWAKANLPWINHDNVEMPEDISGGDYVMVIFEADGHVTIPMRADAFDWAHRDAIAKYIVLKSGDST